MRIINLEGLSHNLKVSSREMILEGDTSPLKYPKGMVEDTLATAKEL